MFTHRYRYWFAFLVSVFTYVSTEFCQVYYFFNIRIEWYYAFLTIFAVTVSTLDFNRLAEPFIKRQWPPKKNKIKHSIAFFAVGSTGSTVLTSGIVFIMSMLLHSYTAAETLRPLELNLVYCWLINLLYHLINAIIFYFKEYKTTALEAEQLKSISAQAELQLIKSQINPHFLFNNLNVLAALIMKDNKEANRFIEEFSKVYRYILSNHDKELVELKQELDFLKPYIFLLEKRFNDGLQIKINIEEQQQNKMIIPASLQMLIENAIKHNVVSRNKPLLIDVHTNGNNTIIVSNNLQQKQTVENSTGIGLQNIIRRYELVSNRKVDIDTTENNFTVTLPLINMN